MTISDLMASAGQGGDLDQFLAALVIAALITTVIFGDR